VVLDAAGQYEPNFRIGRRVTEMDSAQAWSDWNGQPSATNSGAFDTAAASVTEVGLSFGGGCYFENGVGTSDGSGTFTLNTFTVS